MGTKQIERITDIKNDITIDLLSNYSIEELRCLFLCVNHIRTKNKYLEEKEDGWYNGIQYTMDGEYMDENDRYEVSIPLSAFKDYAIKKKRSQDEILAIVENIMDKKICYKEGTKKIFKNLIHTIEYDEEYKEFTIIFIKENFDYIMELDNNFFSIDLGELVELKGKYEVGLYLLYWKWVQKGTAYFNIDQLREYFTTPGETHNYKVIQNIKIAMNNINTKFGYNIGINPKSQKRGSNNITDITIFFPRAATKRKKEA